MPDVKLQGAHFRDCRSRLCGRGRVVDVLGECIGGLDYGERVLLGRSVTTLITTIHAGYSVNSRLVLAQIYKTLKDFFMLRPHLLKSNAAYTGGSKDEIQDIRRHHVVSVVHYTYIDQVPDNFFLK